MSKIKAIAKGAANNILRSDLDVELKAAQRLKTCKGCKAYRYSTGWRSEVCSSSVTVDHVDGGRVKGCGCVINSKIRQDDEPCPAGKW